MSEHEKLREGVAFVRKLAEQKGEEFWPTVHEYQLMQRVIAAAESTLPRTKMVEVWHSEWVNRACTLDELHVAVWPTREDAERDAHNLRTNPRNEGQWSCIRVTGPHQHEVPA